MLGLVWCVLGVVCLAGCGPVVPVDETTTGDEPCIDRQPSIEIATMTIEGHPVTAEVRWAIGDAYPGTLAHFDGSVYAIWGVAGERVSITATDGVCDFEAQVVGVSGCGDDPPARIEFVFDRFCGASPGTTSGGMPEPPPEGSMTSGGDTTSDTTTDASSSEGGGDSSDADGMSTSGAGSSTGGSEPTTGDTEDATAGTMTSG